jgi:hypothetical protein
VTVTSKLGARSFFLVAARFPALAGGPVVTADGVMGGLYHGAQTRGLRRTYVGAQSVSRLRSCPVVDVVITGIPGPTGRVPELRIRGRANPLVERPDEIWARFAWPENRKEKIPLTLDKGGFRADFMISDLAILTYHRGEIRLEIFYKCAGMEEAASAGVFPVRWAGLPKEVPLPPGPELAPNGGFEKGENGAPTGWGLKLYRGFDQLTAFWEPCEGRGFVVRVDTDVLHSEAYPRWKEMELPPQERPPARPKTVPLKKQQYKTVGSSDGVHIVSDFIPVERDVEYLFRVDVFSKKTGVKIFVDGYLSRQGRDRHVYRNQKSCGEAPYEKKFLGRWHTYSWRFHPTRTDRGMPLLTQKIRIKLYSYWPRGEVLFDNVSLHAVARRSRPTADELEKPTKPFKRNPRRVVEDLEDDD